MTHKQVLKMVGICAVLGAMGYLFAASLPEEWIVLSIPVLGVLGYFIGRVTAPWVFKE